MSPSLARLREVAQASSRHFDRIRPLIPASLRTSIQPGPIEDGVWCLLVDSNATAAKLRQLLPSLIEGLPDEADRPRSIRVRVRSPGPG
mgnify:CR=1 FL=1